MDKIKNFKVFTNAGKLFEGTKIAIDVNEIITIYEDTLEKGTRLWSPHNEWSVQETFEQVMEIIEK